MGKEKRAFENTILKLTQHFGPAGNVPLAASTGLSMPATVAAWWLSVGSSGITSAREPGLMRPYGASGSVTRTRNGWICASGQPRTAPATQPVRLRRHSMRMLFSLIMRLKLSRKYGSLVLNSLAVRPVGTSALSFM